MNILLSAMQHLGIKLSLFLLLVSVWEPFHHLLLAETRRFRDGYLIKQQRIIRKKVKFEKSKKISLEDLKCDIQGGSICRFYQKSALLYVDNLQESQDTQIDKLFPEFLHCISMAVPQIWSPNFFFTRKSSLQTEEP